MKDYSLPTKAYILGVIFLGGLLAVWLLHQVAFTPTWLLLAAFLAASFLQNISIFGVTTRSTYSLSWVVYAFILVLEGPTAALVVIFGAHLVEWVLNRNRLAWYIQTFNICNFAIVVTLSYLIIRWAEITFGADTLASFIIKVIALAMFTLVNHALVALVIRLARGQTFSQSGVFDWFTLFLDFTLLCLGFIAVIIWHNNPVALLLLFFVAYMLNEALRIPSLERQAEIDDKTQLYNTRYFLKALEEELSRSIRFKRPLSLIMADLDLLRNINNNYGHLAGDVVLQGIAQILQEMTREYDIVARFGGEEFSLLLPETTPADASIVTERIRARVAATEFEVTTSIHPIRATMSFGIAGREGEEQTTDELIYNADMALYQAKESGRNRICIYDSQTDLESSSKQEEWANLGLISKGTQERVPESGENGRVTKEHKPINPNIAVDAKPLPAPPDIPEPHTDASSPSPVEPRRNYPQWFTNVFIATLAGLTGLIGFLLVDGVNQNTDWPQFILFAVLVLVMEVASIEIYVQETTISTTAALLVAGILLFDAPAAVILGAIIALVSFAKKRMQIRRLVFNSSNHILGGLVVSTLLSFSSGTIETWSLPYLLMIGAGAAGLIFFSTTGLLTIVIGLDSGLSFKSIWLQRFRWLAPYYVALGLTAAVLVFSYLSIGMIGIFIIIMPLLMLRFSQKQYINHTEKLVENLRVTNSKLVQQADEITRLNEEMMLTLARSLDLRDPHVMEHSKHVSRYAVSIANEMDLPAEQVENIRKAALLHDIGKLGVPEEILFKPSKLTASEYELIKEHVAIGAKLIKGCHTLQPLVPFIFHHHEFYDGRGYPQGLSGEGIPLEARIISLADAVEAMASDRPYKKALSPTAIKQEIERCAGRQFDPVVVKAFGRIIAREGDTIIVNSSRQVQKRNLKERELYSLHY